MPEWKAEIRRRLTGLSLEPGRSEEIVEELSQHLDDRYRELLSAGEAEVEAEQGALEELATATVLHDGLRRLEVFGGSPPPALGAPDNGRPSSGVARSGKDCSRAPA
jgi:putative ABC transport system permease protein